MSNEEEVAEPTVLTKAQAYENVYTHLKSQDIAPWVEKKKISSSFQPDFLSWTHVWEFLLQTYPEFELQHLEPIKHDDGSMTVQCKLTIPFGDYYLSRSERLYVMDNSMKAKKNPSGQEINKAEKRCFVKCAALFGLGIQLFTGEDLPEAETANKKEEPKAPPITKPDTPPNEEEKEFVKYGGNDPTTWVDLMTDWATASFKKLGTSDSVREVWSANKGGVDALEKDYPAEFKRLIKNFTDLSNQAKDEEDKDGE
tara:strand:+ start:439 stop:1203 length:765 start_codon:yes stop_codon:yes gene_type:complete